MIFGNNPVIWRWHKVAPAVVAVLAVAMNSSSYSQETHHSKALPASPPAPFIASTAKPFSALIDNAMSLMDYGMKHAPMNGDPEHDFVTMMIPHHQGAIDMAKAVLLYSKDPQLINLAQGIITEQQNEILLMQAWLQRHQASLTPTPTKPPVK
jgi:uncharacterized protein (DUF305 family)